MSDKDSKKKEEEKKDLSQQIKDAKALFDLLKEKKEGKKNE